MSPTRLQPPAAEAEHASSQTENSPSPKEGMAIRMLASDQRAEAERLWRSVEARIPSVPLACSSDWTFTWLRHFGDVVPHRFAVAEAGGRVPAVTLLTEDVRRRGPFKLRRIHIGTAGEPPGESVYVERNGLLADPRERDAVAGALLEALSRDRSWDVLALDGFRSDHAQALIGAGPRLVARDEASPCLDIRAGAGGVDSLLRLLRPRMRSRIRSNLRLLGPIECEFAETPSQALDIFAELCELHQADWQSRGEQGAFASRRFKVFHRDLIARLAPDSVLLFRARTESGTIGCLYCLVDGQDVLFYQGGIVRSDDKRLSQGLLTHVLCMAGCADRGFRLYDLLAGEAAYKRRLTTSEETLVWAQARRLRARVLELGRRNGHA